MDTGKRLGILTLVICILLAWATCFAMWNIYQTIEYYEYKIEELEYENSEIVDAINLLIENEDAIVNYMVKTKQDLEKHKEKNHSESF